MSQTQIGPSSTAAADAVSSCAPEPSGAGDIGNDLRALRAVVEGTAAGTGQAFFRSLVRHLAEAIDVHYAVVGEFMDPPQGRIHATWECDRVAEHRDFDFTTSPSGEVLRHDLVHFPTGVLRHFPRASILAAQGIDGYMAVPLRTASGRVLGFLSVYDERPLPAEPRRLFIMRIFAARATAELERIHAEQRLHASEARYRDLFENAPSAYLIIGTDGRIRAANRRVTDLFGYPLDELVGAPIHSFLPPDSPAGRPRSLEVSRKLLAGEPVAGWEMEMRRKDGRPLWISMWMEPDHGPDGTVEAARSFFVDITGRVLAERERAQLEEQNLYLREEIKSVHNFEQIIGRSPVLMDVLAQVGRVAPTDASVLVTGETGTGKELVARAIHSASKRKDKPLIKVNCAALPAGLIESELFGHEKGAFSGAVARRLGRFELADGGTIFLDEIGELPAEAQVKLLRVLQEREFDRVGGAAPVRTNVRVIAATNRDLLGEVRERTFREDLYYRLNVFPVRLPPLRERRDDIPLLVQFMVKKFAARTGRRIDGVSRQTMQRLQEYPWPGNIRELENVLERAIILANGTTLEVAADLLPAMPPSAGPSSAVGEEQQQITPAARRGGIQGTGADETAVLSNRPAPGEPLPGLEAVERDHILTVLRHTRWVVTGPRGAAKILGLNPSTLRSRIKKLGISRPSAN
jgi:PAS domain S-box-containing protein